MGVIDTLTAGLAVVARYPWLAMIPLLFDLLLWQLPGLYPSPRLAHAIAAPLQAQAAAMPSEGGADAIAFYETLDESVMGLNLWRATVPPLFWPSVLAAEPADGTERQVGWQVDRAGQVVGIALLLGIAALLVNMLWLHLLARAGQGATGRALWPTLRLWLGDTGRLIALALLLVLLALMVMVPVSFGLALLLLAAPGVTQALIGCLGLLVLWLSFWLWLHLYFTAAAMIVGRQGILGAPMASLRLVRRHFWSASGFVLLCLLLSAGFQVIWGLMARSDSGRLLSFVGNSALGTGLAAAMLIFFRERLSSSERTIAT